MSARTAALGVMVVFAAGPVAAHQSLTDRELEAVRGGYISANGVTFGFGAQIQTYVNGALALQSTLTLTGDGTANAQTVASGALGSLSTPQGVVVPGEGGSTTILNSFTSGQILNLVVNSASNRTVQQNTQVVLTLPAFASTQRGAAFQQLSSGLQAALSFSQTTASRR